MIVTWLADVSALHEESKYRSYYEKLPAFRKEKADRLKLQEDKALSVGSWILYETMKKEYSLQGNEIFNISHSGEHVLCSVTFVALLSKRATKVSKWAVTLRRYVFSTLLRKVVLCAWQSVTSARKSVSRFIPQKIFIVSGY